MKRPFQEILDILTCGTREILVQGIISQVKYGFGK